MPYVDLADIYQLLLLMLPHQLSLAAATATADVTSRAVLFLRCHLPYSIRGCCCYDITITIWSVPCDATSVTVVVVASSSADGVTFRLQPEDVDIDN
jgi:hypothetical protein